MSLPILKNLTKSVLYGTGLGEKPSIRVLADPCTALVEGELVTLTVPDSGQFRPGHVISSYGVDDPDDAFVLYVLEAPAADSIKCINGYLGSPPLEDAEDLSGRLVEQQPLVTEHEIFGAIETVYAQMLYPEVHKVLTASIANPNLVDGQEFLPAEVEFIVSAWQYIGPTAYEVSFTRQPMQVDPGVSPTGKIACFSWELSNPGFYTYRTRYDMMDNNIHQMSARGAAALCLGASIAEAGMERAKKDNAEGVDRRTNIATNLWRDFLTLKQAHVENSMRQLPQKIYVNRG